jgi:hypothetical protein
MDKPPWVLFLLLLIVGTGVGQQSGTSHEPTLSHRLPPATPSEGKIKLDVVVTDDAGRPVAGLEQRDFALFDNKKPRPILSFRSVDGVVGAGRSDPPVEVVLLVDVTNTRSGLLATSATRLRGFCDEMVED